MAAIEVKNDHIEEVKGHIEAGRENEIAALLAELHTSDIGSLVAALEEEDAVKLFKFLTPDKASAVLLEVDERRRKPRRVGSAHQFSLNWLRAQN